MPGAGMQRIAASWVNPIYIARTGRLYVFYTYNAHNTTTWPSGRPISNSNLLGGQFVRWSDDAGLSWSARHEVPIRATAIDRGNAFGGKIPQGWSVGKPFVANDGTAFFQLTKIGCPPAEAGTCELDVSYDEAWLYASADINSATPEGAIPTFITLPTGDKGLAAHNRSSGGNATITTGSPVGAERAMPPNVMPTPTGTGSWIAEEGDLVEMGAHTPPRLYYVYRTSDGYLGVGTSADGGLSFAAPLYAEYAHSLPGEYNRLKNPRGPITPRRVFGNRYLLLYFNRGAGGIEGGRNPYFLSAGTYDQSRGTIVWSQPELVLYTVYSTSASGADRPGTKMGYPDLFEDHGDVWITETDKITARIHKVDRDLIAGLLAQGSVAGQPISIKPRFSATFEAAGGAHTIVPTPFSGLDISAGSSISIEAWIVAPADRPGSPEPVIVCGDTVGTGTLVHFFAPGAHAESTALTALLRGPATNKTVSITSQNLTLFGINSQLGDGAWGRLHQVVLIVDGQAQIATYFVDGVFLDGGAQLGTGFYELAELFGVNSAAHVVAPQSKDRNLNCSVGGHVRAIRVYGSSNAPGSARGFLRTSEVVASFQDGPPPHHL